MCYLPGQPTTNIITAALSKSPNYGQLELYNELLIRVKPTMSFDVLYFNKSVKEQHAYNYLMVNSYT